MIVAALLLTVALPSLLDADRALNGPEAAAGAQQIAYQSCDGFLAATENYTPDETIVTLWTIDDPDRPQWRAMTVFPGMPRTIAARSRVIVADCRAVPKDGVPAFADVPDGTDRNEGGSSGDRSFVYRWTATNGGTVVVSVALWNGTAYDVVIDDITATAP